MRKKVLFFTHHIAPSANPNGYRIGQYFPFLEKKGWEVLHITTRASGATLAKALRAADVVYVQRLLLGPLRRSLLKALAKRVVFDFDDAIMYGSKGESPARRRRFMHMILLSDAVFCGNGFLESEAGRHKPGRIFRVPTVVDTNAYPVKEHAPVSPMVAGWMGSASTLRYLAGLGALFAAPPRNTRFKAVADKQPDFGEGVVAFEKWSGEKEKELLLGFDVGMMPTGDDVWSRGKCGLKLIQYAAAGLPALSHPFGVSTEIIEEGETGFLRKDVEGWREAMEMLASDVDSRRRMGRKARAVAEERYSLAVWGPRVAEIVDGL